MTTSVDSFRSAGTNTITRAEVTTEKLPAHLTLQRDGQLRH